MSGVAKFLTQPRRERPMKSTYFKYLCQISVGTRFQFFQNILIEMKYNKNKIKKKKKKKKGNFHIGWSENLQPSPRVHTHICVLLFCVIPPRIAHLCIIDCSDNNTYVKIKVKIFRYFKFYDKKK